MGTTVQSADVMSRVIYGAQTELKVVLIALVMALAVGVPLGLISGYYGGPARPRARAASWTRCSRSRIC